MNKLVAQPFIDESGNLVIPQAVFGKSSQGEVIALQTPNGIIRFLVRGGKVIRVTETEKPQGIKPQTSNDQAITEPTDASETELLELAQSSMDFWDNPVDDAVWNNA